MARKIALLDTTLRDGSQSEGVSFSTEDKLDIADRLDRFGIDYIEGGWPGSNPKDAAFFAAASQRAWTSTLVAFGSTRRAGVRAEDDANLNALASSGARCASIFGKTWDRHVRNALKVPLEENLAMIRDSVAFLKSRGMEVIYDAEHFFDGRRDNPEYAMLTLEAAAQGGADWLTLCDHNGGTLPDAVAQATSDVVERFGVPVGMHAHNDSELAVANSLAAVRSGAAMVQGTINGLGERCGNANLCSIMPALSMKMGLELSARDMSQLTALSAFVGETANTAVDPRAPYVGASAFAHKGGVHASAVLRDGGSYEHIDPSAVGNGRRLLVSELAGTAAVLARMSALGIEADKESGAKVLSRLKELESQGYQFEGADASFELLVRRTREGLRPPFRLDGFRVFVDVSGETVSSEASVKVADLSGMEEHTAADGNGPVNALDRALRKALERFWPELRDVRLADYKVRVIDSKDATGAKVRVLVRSTDGHDSWTTIGVSANVIEASLAALLDSMEYKLMRSGRRSPG